MAAATKPATWGSNLRPPACHFRINSSSSISRHFGRGGQEILLHIQAVVGSFAGDRLGMFVF
jgi:hypothetical protein